MKLEFELTYYGFEVQLLYSHIHIRIQIYTYMQKQSTIMTNFNERTKIKILSLTLYSWKGDVGCVREMSWRQRQTAILTPVLLTIAALLPHLVWGCSTVGHWGPKLSVCCWLSLRHLIPYWLESFVRLVILLFNVHILPLFSLIYTGASLDWQLGWGSIYITVL